MTLSPQVSSLSAVALISRSDATSSTEAATAEKNLAGALRVVAMVAKFCPTILSPSKLNTVLSVLLSPVVKQKMLFPIVLAGAQCIQSLSADLSPTSLAASPDQDGTIAATRALLLDSTEGICSLLVGDFVLEDSEYSK